MLPSKQNDTPEDQSIISKYISGVLDDTPIVIIKSTTETVLIIIGAAIVEIIKTLISFINIELGAVVGVFIALGEIVVGVFLLQKCIIALRLFLIQFNAFLLVAYESSHLIQRLFNTFRRNNSK